MSARVKDLLLISILGIVFITIPAFFERLHSDEVIYWEVSDNISKGRGLVSETSGMETFIWHSPLPFFVTAPFLQLHNHIHVSRLVASLFTVGCAILIYLICVRTSSRDCAIVGSMLFIFSFYALRFGGRFYLDQFGLFFFLGALFFLFRGEFILSGILAVTAVMAREYWLGVYPFFLLYINDRKGILRFAIPLLVVLSVAAGFMVVGSIDYTLIKGYIFNTAITKNLIAFFTDHNLLYPLLRGWIEFAMVNILIFLGFTVWLFKRDSDRRYLLFIVPQFIVISMLSGFIISGGVTQYPLSLTGSMAVYAGSGLKSIYDHISWRILKRWNFISLCAVVVAMQFIGFNILATAVSLHKNFGIYGFGFWDDRKVISLLRTGAHGKYIIGIHGAFVDDRAKWDWTDFHIQQAIEKAPDWFITYSNYVEILPEQTWKGRVVIYEIGPYLVFHSLKKGSLKDAVRERDFPKWRLRRH